MISVVVPLYNKASYVRRCIDSVLAQTIGDLELIIINDGSTDGGDHIAATYGDSRLKLINQPNLGPGAARNRGIAEAKGEFVAFLDADDEWLPEYLEEHLRFIQRHGPEVASVSAGYYELPTGMSREAMWRKRGIADGTFRLTPHTAAARAVATLAYMSPWSTVVRTSIARKHGGFFDRDRCLYAEDAYFWLKVMLNETLGFMLKPLVRFHTEASSLSRPLGRARPIEPFLLDPAAIEASCPSHLRAVLAEILAIRAFKTACVLGYWGEYHSAASLRKRFRCSEDWRLPYFFLSGIASTPVAAGLGWTARACLSRRPG
jgi:glycosyltransferase involved in cell wall biosynthesis